MGGRIGFQEGTTPSVECIKEGAKKINSGKIKSGAEGNQKEGEIGEQKGQDIVL